MATSSAKSIIRNIKIASALAIIGLSLGIVYLSTQATKEGTRLASQASKAPSFTCNVGGWTPLSAWTGINTPIGVAVDIYDNVWVVSDSDHLLRKYDSQGNILANTPLGTSQVWGVETDSLGNVYVALRTGMVFKYDNNGTPTKKLTGLTEVTNIYPFRDTLYVIDVVAGTEYVKLFNLNTFAYIRTLPNNFDDTKDIIVHTPIKSVGGEILTTRSYNQVGSIKRFDIDGNFINEFANSDTNFLARDTAGNIYVTVGNLNLVRKYSSSGTLLESISNSFSAPRGIALSNKGFRLYVADRNHDSIKRFACTSPQ